MVNVCSQGDTFFCPRGLGQEGNLGHVPPERLAPEQTTGPFLNIPLLFPHAESISSSTSSAGQWPK